MRYGYGKSISDELFGLRQFAKVAEHPLPFTKVPGTSSAFAERINGGNYLEITPDRHQLARYGLMVCDVQRDIASAMGAETITTTVEGRERYAVNLRYPREIRSDPQAIAHDVLVPMANGASIPLGEVAKIELTQGPSSIRTENA